MSTKHYLSALLEPNSVAIVGASEKPEAVGHVILANILAGRFKGKVWPVNPKYAEVLGMPCAPSLEEIGAPIDLAIATTAPRTIPAIVEQCAKAGIRYLVVANNLTTAGHAAVEKRMLDAARQLGVRILGPKSLGIIRPHNALNATFARTPPLAGDLALITQSGAMAAALLDWATANRIGISSLAVVGNASDIDFGEVLDFLAYDDKTRHILLHVERVRNTRSFMSALRSAARSKPVILFKSEELSSQGSSAEDNAGGTVSARAIFDAAVSRAGVVQVKGISQLFHAAKALATGFRPRSNRLAIVSNGSGPAAMTVDAARAAGVPFATLAEPTNIALKAFLPLEWNGGNPVDLGGDATPERYLKVIETLRQDEDVGAVLVILSPLAMARPEEVATGIVKIAGQHRVPICCCFMGGELIAEARRILEQAGVPAFRNPETVLELFRDIANYYDNQKLLLQTPTPASGVGAAGYGNARVLIDTLLAENRRTLSPIEIRGLLHSFGIACSPLVPARSASEAMFQAEQLGLPVDMRLDGHDCVGGAGSALERTNLSSLESVRLAYHDIVNSVRRSDPDTGVSGVILKMHIDATRASRLSVGIHRDPVFGPVICCGASGEVRELLPDQAVSLPPLNDYLAERLVESTGAAWLLDRLRSHSPGQHQSLKDVLIAISNLACELPWIRSLSIDPLIIDAQGVHVGSASMTLDPQLFAGKARYAHMAIHPYPSDLVRQWPLRDGRVGTVRPVRPEDAALALDFFNRLSAESRYFRFMERMDELPRRVVARFTQVDYDRELALIALITQGGRESQIGVARYTQTADGESVDFALVVADDWQRSGLGRRLMDALLDSSREKSYRFMVGDVLSANQKMLRLMTSLGFAILPHPDGGELKRVVKQLHG